jgi:hypothetical protein
VTVSRSVTLLFRLGAFAPSLTKNLAQGERRAPPPGSLSPGSLSPGSLSPGSLAPGSLAGDLPRAMHVPPPNSPSTASPGRELEPCRHAHVCPAQRAQTPACGCGTPGVCAWSGSKAQTDTSSRACLLSCVPPRVRALLASAAA